MVARGTELRMCSVTFCRTSNTVPSLGTPSHNNHHLSRHSMSRPSNTVDLFRIESGMLNASDSFHDDEEDSVARIGETLEDRTRLMSDEHHYDKRGECDASSSSSLAERLKQKARKALSSSSSGLPQCTACTIRILASAALLTGILLLVGRPHLSSHPEVDPPRPASVKRPPPRPTLHTLIGDFKTDVKANVQWLLDFAIIGHSKCATTTQQLWLRNHPEIVMHDYEVHSLRQGRPAELVSLLYTLPESSETVQRPKHGYKEPNDIRSPVALHSIRQYWPNTKLILGVRHPVKWFESYYNYNSRRNQTLPPAEEMIGKRLPDHAKFHLHLSQLGKTTLKDARERELLGRPISGSGWTDDTPVPRMRNKVFLYETSQPFDSREGRDVVYREDLAHFLDLTIPLKPIRVRTKQSPNYHYAIDICDSRFQTLRAQLVEDGRIAAEWITDYFLKDPDVTVSSPDHFVELLQSWSRDPCDATAGGS